MSRRLNALLRRGFRASKCKTLLTLTVSRIKLLRNKRDISAKQARKDIALLLQTGQETTARTRIENVFREENTLAAYNLIQQYCELVINRLPLIDAQKDCPNDLKEAISSLVFAAPRCSDLQELHQVRDLFTAKYGKEFAAAAAELRPECGVNKQIIEKLSSRAPSGDIKRKLMKEIASEHKIDWDAELEQAQSELLNTPEDLLDGSRHLSEDPEEAAQTGSKNDEPKLQSIETIPAVLDSADATLTSASPASLPTSSSHSEGNVSPVEGKLPLSAGALHGSPPHDTSVLSNSKDAADSTARLDADHDTGSMHVPSADPYSIAKDEGGMMDLKSTSDPHSSTGGENIHDECISAPLAEAESSLSKSDEPSSPPSRKPFEAGTYFQMGGRMKYKDFASAAQAAFESAAHAAEAAQAAVDLARDYSKPSSDTKVVSSDREELKNSSISKEATRVGKTATGLEISKRNRYDDNREGSADSQKARKGTNVVQNAPQWVYSEQKGFDGNDGETTSDSDDGVGGMSSNRASQHTIHDERLSRYTGINLGAAADLDKRSSLESAGGLDKNPGPLWKRRAAAGDAGLLQTRQNEESNLYGLLGRPRFDDDATNADYADLDKRDFEKFAGSPNRPIQQRVFPRQERHNSPFAEEGDSDSGEEFGRKMRSKTELNVRKVAAQKEAIDGPLFEPQFDELGRVPPLRSYNRKQEMSHDQLYVASGDPAAAAQRGFRGNHLTDKRSPRRTDAAPHRKLRWNSTSTQSDGELLLELDSEDHEWKVSNQRHNFGEGDATEASKKHGGAVVDESLTPRGKSYYGLSCRSIKSPRSQQGTESPSSFEREDANCTLTAIPEDAQPNQNNFSIPKTPSPEDTPFSTLTVDVLDRNTRNSSLTTKFSNSSVSTDSSIHPSPSSQSAPKSSMSTQTSVPQASTPSHPPKESEFPKSKPLQKNTVSRPVVTHLKLPNYEDLTARFEALRKKQ